eukprot:359668-Chlamydomonas_euryale.AAC.3
MPGVQAALREACCAKDGRNHPVLPTPYNPHTCACRSLPTMSNVCRSAPGTNSAKKLAAGRALPSGPLRVVRLRPSAQLGAAFTSDERMRKRLQLPPTQLNV